MINVSRIYHVGINVSDIERSIRFYEGLGFSVLYRKTMRGDASTQQTIAAFGGSELEAETASALLAMMTLARGDEDTAIALFQWIEPPSPGSPHSIYSHTGIFRVAFYVENFEAVRMGLESMGVTLLGPPQTMKSNSGTESYLLAFLDPDGNFLQVLGGVLKPGVSESR